MGWKGNLRAINSSLRAMEREAKRRQRELEKEEKLYAKMMELEQAEHDVEVFNNYVDRIQSIHKEASRNVDWRSIARQEAPFKPKREDSREKRAAKKCTEYAPGLFDKLFGRVDKKRQSLVDAIDVERRKDEEDYRRRLRQFETNMKEWEDENGLASRVLEGEPSSYIQALEKLGAYKEIDELGSGLKISVEEDGFLRLVLNVHSKEIIPDETKSLLKSGKLSVKKMNKGTYNELFQDYVCSAVLRVARETFAVLPVDKVLVTATDDVLNKASGHLEDTPIVSVLIVRQTIEKMNMDRIDPSDSMSNFLCNMNFSRTTGFKSVDVLEVTADVSG